MPRRRKRRPNYACTVGREEKARRNGSKSTGGVRRCVDSSIIEKG